jgi:hypothetical protein
MNHLKIVLLWLKVKNKMVSKLAWSLVMLTGMIVHGHGDEAFAQYFNELWPNDHNFTIWLLLGLFRSLENELVKESHVFFEFEPQNAFF